MRREIILLVLGVVVCLGMVVEAGVYGAGTGTPEDPYQIWTAEQMNTIGLYPEDWDKQFILMNDIDLSAYTGTQYNIIGINLVQPFSGVFDGNGHSIINFSYTVSDSGYIGLFGFMDGNNAKVQNLRIENPDIDADLSDCVGALIGYVWIGSIDQVCVIGGTVRGGSYVGALIGRNGGVIVDCFAETDVFGAESYTGGLVGYSMSEIISSCASGQVVGSFASGGLAGANDSFAGKIYDSYAIGRVYGDNNVGGLAGINGSASMIVASYASGMVSVNDVWGNEGGGGLIGYNSGYVLNCYATGNVSGPGSIGGLAGSNCSCNPAYMTIENCYSIGEVSGYSGVCGLVGSGSCPDGWVLNSFWDVQTSGTTYSVGGTGLTTAQMQDPDTFLNAGWDFFFETANGTTDVWFAASPVSYPLLWHESDIQPEPVFTKGNGTDQNPYIITTETELNSISDNPRYLDCCFELACDIDLAGVDFNMIGKSYRPFRGHFNGNKHFISNLTLDSPALPIFEEDNYSAGLFSRLTSGAEVANLHLIDVYVEDGLFAGGLVGFNLNGSIRNCSVAGIINGYSYLGGLVGESVSGRIENCHASVSITGEDFLGGLVGSNSGNYCLVKNCSADCSIHGESSLGGLVGHHGAYFAHIENCYAMGEIISEDLYGSKIGGLLANARYGTIKNCYARTNCSGSSGIGGLIGFNGDSELSNCYASGIIIGEEDKGGLVGYDNDGVYKMSFWDSTVNPTLDGIGNLNDPNVIGLPTSEFQAKATFTDAGWDFVDVWDICEGTNYPRLIWQIPAADFTCPDGVGTEDLLIMTSQWLQPPGTPSADIAPEVLDGIVNLEDFAVLAQNWLREY